MRPTLVLEAIIMLNARNSSGFAEPGALSRQRKTLLGFLLFNGVSAVAGGLALMTDWIPEQVSWVRHTDFPSNYFPGVILMAVVGGSALIAAVALMKGIDGWQLASIVAGMIMVFWIVGEIASIRGFHFLQVIYLVTGALTVVWTPSQPAAANGRS
ncbi:hypothetical protein [Aeromicrobium sp.]|uniref:hypothetical protein n=1 Tax=Aeromicrobium sp. TaxID=1871063 RepID=UPI002FC7FBFC